ncbi:MAG: acyltransferase [Lachnospiraceae bacterium]|nr:acyltransferase [Lachnospiraceae bacterium]
MKQSENRNRTLDVIKGIAILLVLYTHYEWTKEQRQFFVFPYIVDMAIPVFMIISGYTYSLSFERHGIKNFGDAYKLKNLAGKIIRYTVPFLILVVWEIFDRNIYLSSHEPLYVLRWLLNGTDGKGSYYYPVLIQLVFFFPVIYFIIRKLGDIKGMLLCLGANAVYELLRWSYGMGDECYRLLMFRYILLLGVGVCTYRGYRFKPLPALVITFVGIFFIAATAYLGYVPRIITSWTSTCFISVMWIIPLISWMIQNLKGGFLPLEVLGRASYHIFLVQMVYYLGYYEKVKGLVSEHFASGDTVHLILGMIISILVGVSFYYLEKPLSGRLVRLLK